MTTYGSGLYGAGMFTWTEVVPEPYAATVTAPATFSSQIGRAHV